MTHRTNQALARDFAKRPITKEETQMIHFIVWIIVSGFAGFVASKIINKSGSGLFMDIILGIVGGFVGGFIVSHVPVLNGLGGRGGMVGLVIEVIVAILGAMLVIYVWDLLFRRGRTA
jgi:uncharacterized membrane protein YeaQ/YmgE (transglycosylase-associated protein family)